MVIAEFTESANVDLLWEIIYDTHVNDNTINIRDPNTSLHFKTEFISKFNEFTKNVKNTSSYTDLVSLNKDFILTYVNSLNSNVKVKEPEPIQITIEDIESYRTDNRIDIQSTRITNFEKELKLKQNDFEDSMKIKVPVPLDFKDRELDKPIEKMEELIARTLAQRNFEIEQIHIKTQNPEEAEKWLQPQETSVKTDKVVQKNIKTTGIDNKHVTWNDNITFEIKEENKVVPNIFTKLKIHNNPEEESIIVENSYDKPVIEIGREKETELHFLKTEFNKLNTKLDDIFNLLSMNIRKKID
jgi:hypothetical protein